MIVEKTDILCNGRIIKYLSAHSLNGCTASSGDVQKKNIPTHTQGWKEANTPANLQVSKMNE